METLLAVTSVALPQFRRRVYHLLEGPGQHSLTGRMIEWLLIFLIIANSFAVVVSSVPRLHDTYEFWWLALEYLSVAVFTLEYLVRLWISPERDSNRNRSLTRARMRYVLSATGLFDLAAILPFWMGVMTDLDLRFLRILRLLQMLKLTRYSPALQSLAAALYEERRSFLGALLIVLMLQLFSASVIHLVEHEAQPEAFGTIADSMWWAIITLATVGYGDVVPKTPLGKMVGGLVAFAGLCLLALPAGIMAKAFAEEIKRRDFVVNVKLVSKVPLFTSIDINHLVEIATMLKPRSVAPLRAVVRKGDPSDCMYFVLSGELEVEVAPKPVRLGPGSFFGEMGLLNHGPRGATVTSVTDSQLLMLMDDDFDKLMKTYPDVLAEIRRVAAERTQPTKVKPALDWEV